jgi:hypothetical protein
VSLFGVNPTKNYIFGILTSRANDWYINESILRGSGGGEWARGGRGIWGGVSIILLGHFHELLYILLESSAQAQSIGTLVR